MGIDHDHFEVGVAQQLTDRVEMAPAHYKFGCEHAQRLENLKSFL